MRPRRRSIPHKLHFLGFSLISLCYPLKLQHQHKIHNILNIFIDRYLHLVVEKYLPAVPWLHWFNSQLRPPRKTVGSFGRKEFCQKLIHLYAPMKAVGMHPLLRLKKVQRSLSERRTFQVLQLLFGGNVLNYREDTRVWTDKKTWW